MRRLILAAAGLALLLPAALSQVASAQTAPGAGAPPAGQAGDPGLPPPLPGGPRGPGGPGKMPPPPPPSRAAHFHVQRGDAVVDVKCADDDTTKTCADIVGAMLDRLASLPAPARN